MTNDKLPTRRVSRQWYILSAFILSSALTIAGMNTEGGLSVATSHMKIVFSTEGNIESITPQYQLISGKSVNNVFAATDSTPLLRIHFTHDRQHFAFDTLITMTDNNDSVTTVRFVCDSYQIAYFLHSDTYTIDITLQSTNGGPLASPPLQSDIRLELDRHGNREVRSIGIIKHHEIDLGKKHPVTDVLSRITWFGVRYRFWTLLVKPTDQHLRPEITDRAYHWNVVPVSPPQHSYRIYVGPVEYHELAKTDPACTYLLYPLWFWMRWLTIGLLQLFNTLLHLSANTVLSIALLSICVKIIIAPLFSIANRWQSKVNEQKSLLEPRLREIKKQFKGEEQTKRTLALHKELGISPLYSLKSLLSAAIQIPIFFAAYHMLNEHIALQGVSFLWIKDCSYPDRFCELPFTLPFLGNYFNLLPFIMTAVTLAASFIHSDRSLSVTLYRKQRDSLFIMAAFFFLLLYASSAGMLLYWTINNILALLMTIMKLIIQRKRPAPSPLQDAGRKLMLPSGPTH